METISLNDFLEEFKDIIAQEVIKNYPPIYNPEERDMFRDKADIMLRAPYPAQLDTANSICLTLKERNSALVVGEMGTGKTIISIAVAHFSELKRILVMCPPHLVNKWAREIKETLPDVNITQLKTLKDMYWLMDRRRQAPRNQEWYILSRERAKLSYQWRPAFLARKNGAPTSTILHCPSCNHTLVDEDDVPLTQNDLSRKKHKCPQCQDALWQADGNGTRRYALADFIKKKFKNFFDLLIADEIHEYKSRGTAQGFAAGALASACKKALGLTGTLFGGYSSTLFYLLYRLTDNVRNDFRHNEESKWINRFGIVEKITKKKRIDDDYQSNISSRGKKYYSTTREKPGLLPVVLPNYLLDKTAFIRLPDLALNLPPYNEEVIGCEMTEEQSVAYNRLYGQLHAELVAKLRNGNKSLLSIYLQSLLSYPDRCYEGEIVKDPRSGAVIATAPALDSQITYPKEGKLIELCRQEKAAGRRTLVYVTHTDRRDITKRLKDLLEGRGLKTLILKSNTVKAEDREKWIQDHLDNLDVLIVHPRLVQTGLDLVDFPTIIFQEVEYSVYTLRQASRRSWRIGQTRPVKVYFLVYENTIQEQGLKLIALKHKTSLAIEGELLDDGLAAYNSSDSNIFYELARNIVDKVEITDSIDHLWAQVLSAQQDISTLLTNLPVPQQADLSVPWQAGIPSMPETAIVTGTGRPTVEELYRQLLNRPRTLRRQKQPAIDSRQKGLWAI